MAGTLRKLSLLSALQGSALNVHVHSTPCTFFSWKLHQRLAAARIAGGTVFAKLSASAFACWLLLSSQDALLTFLLGVGQLIRVYML